MADIDLDRIKDTKQLQFNVLKRFMSNEEIKKLLVGYMANTKIGYIDRKQMLNSNLTPIEKRCLRKYLFEPEKSLTILAKESGFKAVGTYISRIEKAAFKILYQNRELLKLSELVGWKGGEEE